MTRIEIATRLYAAAISNAELVNQTAEQLRHASIAQADALLAECGKGERKVEVTEEKANAIYSLCSQIMKEPIEMHWFCERLSDIINGGDA